MTTLSSLNSGLSGRQSLTLAGSSSMSSRPAPAIQPSLSARWRARSSMISPRAVLIRIAVGFMRRSWTSSNRWCVCDVSGAWITRQSDSVTNSSNDTAFAPATAISLTGR
jgi:hypothetical protein